MSIHLNTVNIENLRSIKNAGVDLNPFTVMFGMNDSGKSNFLLALGLALGSKNITEKDIHCSQNTIFSTDTCVIIDLMFVPIDEAGKRTEVFDDTWGRHLGDNIQSDKFDRDFFAFRTKFTYDVDKGEYGKERILITSWDENKITEGKLIGNTNIKTFVVLTERDRL